MTAHRNIITVDGFQVEILGRTGIINKYELIALKRQFAEDNNIPKGLNGRGIGCVFQKPKQGLDVWYP